MKKLTLAQTFEWLHNHPPEPFNPDYDPKARDRYVATSKIIATLEPFVSREARARAWREAYEDLKAKGQ